MTQIVLIGLRPVTYINIHDDDVAFSSHARIDFEGTFDESCIPYLRFFFFFFNSLELSSRALAETSVDERSVRSSV